MSEADRISWHGSTGPEPPNLRVVLESVRGIVRTSYVESAAPICTDLHVAALLLLD